MMEQILGDGPFLSPTSALNTSMGPAPPSIYLITTTKTWGRDTTC